MESYAAGETEPPLLEETIGGNFDRTVAAYPDHEALVEFASGRRWTYRELNHDVDLFARGLVAGGLAKGDRIGVWAPSCAEWTIAQLATAKVGAILVNVNPAYRTHEFTYAVNHSGLRMLISAESFKTSDYRSMIEETTADTPRLERVVYIGTSDWDDVVAAGEKVDADVVNERMRTLQPNDPINIQYTSGTTGYPKGATLSHRNILNNGYFVTETINLTENDRLCIPVPFYHCFGMVMGNLGCTTHGATMVIPAPGFDPETTLRCIAEERCTAVYGVPTMFIAMQNHPTFRDHDLTSLRTGIMAGSICPVEVMKRCRVPSTSRPPTAPTSTRTSTASGRRSRSRSSTRRRASSATREGLSAPMGMGYEYLEPKKEGRIELPGGAIAYSSSYDMLRGRRRRGEAGEGQDHGALGEAGQVRPRARPVAPVAHDPRVGRPSDGARPRARLRGELRRHELRHARQVAVEELQVRQRQGHDLRRQDAAGDRSAPSATTTRASSRSAGTSSRTASSSTTR